MKLCIQPLLISPRRVAPIRIDGHGAERSHSNLSLDRQAHDERTQANGKLTQLDRCRCRRDRVVRSADDSNPAADSLTMHTRDDELGRTNHRTYEIHESHEELLSTLDISDRLELVEGCTRAKCAVPLTSDQDHASVAVLASRRNRIRQLVEQP